MMNDISSDPHDCIVEVDIREDGQVVWINIDGITALRACRVKELIITDRRNPDDGIQVRGSEVSRDDVKARLLERFAPDVTATEPGCVFEYMPGARHAQRCGKTAREHDNSMHRFVPPIAFAQDDWAKRMITAAGDFERKPVNDAKVATVVEWYADPKKGGGYRISPHLVLQLLQAYGWPRLEAAQRLNVNPDDLVCERCGRDNRNGTHTALEGSHLDHEFAGINPEVYIEKQEAGL